MSVLDIVGHPLDERLGCVGSNIMMSATIVFRDGDNAASWKPVSVLDERPL